MTTWTGTQSGAPRDRVVPEQVLALWTIREELGPALSEPELQLVRALRVALRAVDGTGAVRAQRPTSG